jgi:hypothetical protein
VTPTRGKPFKASGITATGVTMLFGKKETSTFISWQVLEGVREQFSSKYWVPIGPSST